MPDYDSSHLLDLLRQHTAIPACPGYDDEDSLRLLTATLHGYILPLVKSQGQDFWVSAESSTALLPLVEGQTQYTLPSRGVASSIRKAVLAGPAGQRSPLRLMEIDRAEERSTTATGTPHSYSIRGGRIVLYPAPRGLAGWSLRLLLVIRPSRLVLLEECAEVASVAGNVISFADPAPAELQAALRVDVVRSSPPFETVAIEAEATWTTPSTVELSSLAAGDVLPGDYVCLPGASPFPQCPVELLDLLAVRVAAEQLAAIADTAVASAKAASLQERRADAAKTVTPRTGEARTRPNGMRKWRGGRSYW